MKTRKGSTHMLKSFRCLTLAFLFIFLSGGRCLEFKNAGFVDAAYYPNGTVHIDLHNWAGLLGRVTASLVYQSKDYLGWSNEVPTNYIKIN
jgi:hypothetical protein